MSPPTIDNNEFLIEPTPSGYGYFAYLPNRTTSRGVGDTPDAAIASLTKMLDPANDAGAIMNRMPILGDTAIRLLCKATREMP